MYFTYNNTKYIWKTYDNFVLFIIFLFAKIEL